MKAKLTGRQVISAIIAGVFGHLLFGGGWVMLGFVLFGGVLTGILGLTVSSIVRQFSDDPNLLALFDGAGGVVSSIFVVALITAFVLMLVGYLVSGLILRGGRVRKPWGTTFWSALIAAVLSVPLLLVYWAISGNGEGGLPFPLVAFLGTIITGVLIWLWMTWAHRGRVEAPQIPTPPATSAVES